jgi:hypothetical protein
MQLLEEYPFLSTVCPCSYRVLFPVHTTLSLSTEHLRRKMLDRSTSWRVSMLFPASGLLSIRAPSEICVSVTVLPGAARYRSPRCLNGVPPSRTRASVQKSFKNCGLPRARPCGLEALQMHKVARMAIDRWVRRTFSSILQYQLVPIIYLPENDHRSYKYIL